MIYLLIVLILQMINYLKTLGEFLQFSWSIYFKHKFPNKNIIIECISNTHNYGDILSFYTKS